MLRVRMRSLILLSWLLIEQDSHTSHSPPAATPQTPSPFGGRVVLPGECVGSLGKVMLRAEVVWPKR